MKEKEIPTCWKIWEEEEHYEAIDRWGNNVTVIGRCDIIANFHGYDIGGELVCLNKDGVMTSLHPNSVNKT